MLDAPDFMKKQILIYVPKDGDTMSYRNDNVVIKDRDGKIKYQTSCYQLFSIFVIGHVSITSGLILRAKRFRYSICMMTSNLKVYHIINSGLEGNTMLHARQYEYQGTEIAQHIIWNKINNQRATLAKIRKKTPAAKEAINKLDGYMSVLKTESNKDLTTLLGIEGSASRVYFSQLFSDCNWKGRKPRVKHDYINVILDIGYTMLFNFIDSLLQLYGFDVYYGVLHRAFYMRKSLVCDIMEPFRPLIDWKVRTAIRLGQCKEDDFELIKCQWNLKYGMIAKYTEFIMETILDHKMDIFYYVQAYYRCFMKRKPISQYPVFNMESK